MGWACLRRACAGSWLGLLWWVLFALLQGTQGLSAQGLCVSPSELGELKAIFVRQSELTVSLEEGLKRQRKTIEDVQSSLSRHKELLLLCEESLASSRGDAARLQGDLNQTRQSLESLQRARAQASRSLLDYKHEAETQIAALQASLVVERRRVRLQRWISAAGTLAAVCVLLGSLR